MLKLQKWPESVKREGRKVGENESRSRRWPERMVLSAFLNAQRRSEKEDGEENRHRRSLKHVKDRRLGWEKKMGAHERERRKQTDKGENFCLKVIGFSLFINNLSLFFIKR